MSPPYSVGSPEGVRVVNTEFGRISIVICADSFVDAHVERVAGLKPDLVIVPHLGRRPERGPQFENNLETLVASRAKLCKCPVVGRHLVGETTQGPWERRTYGGRSVVADGFGAVLTVLRDRDTDVQLLDLAIAPKTQ